MLVLSCSPIIPNRFNENDTNEFGQCRGERVDNFSEIPKYLLENMDKMGVDSSSILNEYEGRYFNCIFKTDSLDFNLVGKKVGFLRSKVDYFRQTRSRDRNFTTVGGSYLYIFNAAQKEDSGGYDAAIIYWSKFALPVKTVVKRLKNR